MNKNLIDLINADDILKNAINFSDASPCDISGLSANSQKVEKNFLFVAKKGATKNSRDGHEFIDQAIKNGAKALLISDDFSKPIAKPIRVFRTKNVNKILSQLSEAFYDYPSKKLQLIGLTGTNGKTSTSFLLHAILKEAGLNARIMGTLGVGEPENLLASTHTTLEPEEISQTFFNFVAQNVSHVIMEVSSHALELDRVNALNFCVTGLTNISHEHLDFHETFDQYKKSKAKLFLQLCVKGKKIFPKKNPLENLLEKISEKIFYGENNCEINFSKIICESDQTIFNLTIKNETQKIILPLIGSFHVYNASLAAACAYALKISSQKIFLGLQKVFPIAGRMEKIPSQNDQPKVFVDFAHTPDALESLLKMAQSLPHEKIFLVFGCGGDRDSQKRPQMGAIAEKYADTIFICDDNPRSENPKTIHEQIVSGIKNFDEKNIFIIEKRQEAIKKAIHMAKAGDIVLIAGKGHENYQLVGQNKLYFSDQEEAKKALSHD